MLTAVTGALRRALRRSGTMSAGCRICGANGDSRRLALPQGHRQDRVGLRAEGQGGAVRPPIHILCSEISPERLLYLIRNHWKIENCLDKVLDFVMDEDRIQNRTLSGPECCAAILRIALNIVRLQDDEHSIKGRMEIAAMTDEYLLGLLANVIGKF